MVTMRGGLTPVLNRVNKPIQVGKAPRIGSRALVPFYQAKTGVTFGSQNGLTNTVAVGPYLGTTRLAVWSKLKRGVWARDRYDIDSVPTGPMSRRARTVIPTMALVRAKDMTQVGAWNAYTNTSTTGSNSRAVGNTAIATATAGRKITYTIAAPADGLAYDVWVAFTQRTAGGFCKPTIDGDQTLVIISDPQSLGFKAFSCYGSVDNTRRNLVKIASGLTGSHSVELEAVNGVPTGSSAVTIGTTTIEAVLYTAELTNAATRASHWAQGQTIAIGDECEYGGRYYAATTAGTTGASPLVHTTSTASDGVVTWSAAGLTYFSGWVGVSDTDYASEVEGAVVSLVYGGNTYDVGGQTHGNVSAANRSIKLDGVEINWTDAMTLSFGASLAITEDQTWFSTSIGSDNLASGPRSTVVTGGQTINSMTMTALVAFTVATAYGAMLPFVHYDGLWKVVLFTKLVKPDGTEYTIESYADATPQSLGKVYSAAIYGDFPVVGRVAEMVSCNPEAVNAFAAADSDANCIMNVTSHAAPPTDGVDWQGKLYFERNGAAAQAISVGDVLYFRSTHLLGAS